LGFDREAWSSQALKVCFSNTGIARALEHLDEIAPHCA